MATIGLTTEGASWNGFENAAYGAALTMPANGTLNSVKAWLRESTTNNSHNVTARIYNSSTGALIASSTEQVGPLTTTAALITFTGFGTVNLVNGTTYHVVCHGSGGGGECQIAGEASGGSRVSAADTYADGPADPITFGTGSENTSIHMDYTPAGANPWWYFFLMNRKRRAA